MLIGISGKIGSGKDALAQMIQQYVQDFKIVRFADKLKDIVCLLTGCTRKQLEDRAFKETSLGPSWIREDFDQRDNMTYTIPPLTYREALQIIGTDLFREQFHLNTWVNATMSDYKEIILMRESHYHGESINTGLIQDSSRWPAWIIPDVRFPNEADAIIENGGILIRIEGRGIKSQHEHISETALDYYTKFDLTINNIGTLEDLRIDAHQIVKDFKLITNAGERSGRNFL